MPQEEPKEKERTITSVVVTSVGSWSTKPRNKKKCRPYDRQNPLPHACRARRGVIEPGRSSANAVATLVPPSTNNLILPALSMLDYLHKFKPKQNGKHARFEKLKNYHNRVDWYYGCCKEATTARIRYSYYYVKLNCELPT